VALRGRGRETVGGSEVETALELRIAVDGLLGYIHPTLFLSTVLLTPISLSALDALIITPTILSGSVHGLLPCLFDMVCVYATNEDKILAFTSILDDEYVRSTGYYLVLELETISIEPLSVNSFSCLLYTLEYIPLLRSEPTTISKEYGANLVSFESPKFDISDLW